MSGWTGKEICEDKINKKKPYLLNVNAGAADFLCIKAKIMFIIFDNKEV